MPVPELQTRARLGHAPQLRRDSFRTWLHRSYALTMLWRDRHRYLPALFAVAMSVVIGVTQSGTLLGFIRVSARPVESSSAMVWVTSREAAALGHSYPIPEAWRARLLQQPEVVQAEPYLVGMAKWSRAGGHIDTCYISGLMLEDGGLGAPPFMPQSLRMALAEPGGIIVDVADLGLLGLEGSVGETAEVAGRRVRLVGLLHRGPSNLMPMIFCSLRTARMLLPEVGRHPRHTMYLLARCRRHDQVEPLVNRLRQEYPDMGIFDQDSFAWRTSMHWLIKTRAGVILSFSTVLALAVGALVTGQTLYAATVTAQREFAVLRALGLPSWRLVTLVLEMSFWIGAGGIAIGLPLALSFKPLLQPYRIELALPIWLCAMAVGVTLGVSMVSGWKALQTVRRVAPATLLR